MSRSTVRIILLSFLLFAGLSEGAMAVNDYIFPQIAFGTYGNMSYRTRFTIAGDGDVWIYFFAADGSPLPITMSSGEMLSLNGTNSSFYGDFQDETVTCMSSGSGTLDMGWAWIRSEKPLYVVSCSYGIYLTDTPDPPMEFEVAVSPSRPATDTWVEAVVRSDDPLPGLITDMSFAIANPNSDPIIVTARVFTSQGPQDKNINIPARGQTADYLRLLFPELGPYKDVVNFYSRHTFCLMAIRTTSHPDRTVYTSIPSSPRTDQIHETKFEQEPNNSLNTADPIGSLPAVATGSFCQATDDDIFVVSLQNGQTITACLLDHIFGIVSDQDVYLDLLDDVGSVLTTGASLWGFGDQDFTYTATRTGNFFVRVTGTPKSGSYPAEYTLLLQTN